MHNLMIARNLAGLGAGLLLLGALAVQPACAGAEPVELPGLNFEVNSSMFDNLKGLIGKQVHVTLSSGATFTGNVKAVSSELLHLEKLESKEFFDALVRIPEIEAIDTRFREYKR